MQDNRRYTGKITYYEDNTLFDAPEVRFSLQENEGMSRDKVTPNSPVYRRARECFNQEEYMYPAPPLYLGGKDIQTTEHESYLLRLLIKQPGSDFVLPQKIGYLKDFIQDCSAYQRTHFPEFENRFVYITVRSGPLKSTKEDEFHTDGFQGISVPRHIPEQNYVWVDNNPTLFSM